MIFLLFTLFVTACQPISVPAAPVQPDKREVISEPIAIDIVDTASYGQFDGVDYIRFEGRLIRTDSGTQYNVPFEVVAPADLEQGNGTLLIEPYHFVSGSGARDGYLTPELLFNRGFSHASVCWESSDDAQHPCYGFQGDEGIGITIISDFARMFKTGNASEMVDTPQRLYSIGFSNSTYALFPLLLDPRGQNLFDLSFLVTTGWPLPLTMDFRPPVDNPPLHIPSVEAGRVIVFLSEADIVLYGSTLRDDGSRPNYHSYEVAGAAHIPAPMLNTTGVDWTPVLRALFIAGDQWVTEGVEPPQSISLEQSTPDEVDPVYMRKTGIARDPNLNATGGIRLPDVVLGRGQFIAVDAENFVLTGTFLDLKCQPLSDGSVRFPDHETYLDQFEQQVQQLVTDRFLLPADAERLVKEAVAQDVTGCVR
jgi:hypothetical protein